MLEVNNIRRSFGSGDAVVSAVDDVSFSLDEGTFASIIGKSGSGKTTLLSLMGALDRPTSGSILVDGQDIAQMSDHALIQYRRQKIGFVFQNYNLVPNLSALENVMLPMEYAKRPKAERRKRAIQLLEEVGLNEDQTTRKPGKLSGGQQQRVAIARALANQPKLILADEPTGNLDSQTGKMVFELLHKIAKNENTTIVTVTHDLSIAGRTDMTFTLSDGKLIRSPKS